MPSSVMRAKYAQYGFLATAALLAGCVPPASTSQTDAGGSDGSDGGDTAGTVTYTKDVQPIFMARCNRCHTNPDLGLPDIGTTYTEVLKPVENVESFGCWNDTDPTMFTMPKKVGECALILIMSGRMPSGAGCGNAMPLEPTMCLSSDQKAVIAAWVAAGMPR